VTSTSLSVGTSQVFSEFEQDLAILHPDPPAHTLHLILSTSYFRDSLAHLAANLGRESSFLGELSFLPGYFPSFPSSTQYSNCLSLSPPVWNLPSPTLTAHSAHLSVTPTHLTLIASCSANGNTYPIGPTSSPSNTIPANTSSILWNPWQWEQIPGAIPFAEATYVLKIWDERGPGVGVKGGYLSPYSGMEFAMYRPASYTPISGTLKSPFPLEVWSAWEKTGSESGWRLMRMMIDGWTCTTCSRAATGLSEPAGLAVCLSLVITLFSAWNILRR